MNKMLKRECRLSQRQRKPIRYTTQHESGMVHILRREMRVTCARIPYFQEVLEPNLFFRMGIYSIKTSLLPYFGKVGSVYY